MDFDPFHGDDHDGDVSFVVADLDHPHHDDLVVHDEEPHNDHDDDEDHHHDLAAVEAHHLDPFPFLSL